MNVLKKVAKKVENSKIVKNPKFLLIGLIIIVSIIALIYFIFLKYSPIMNFKYEGYAISGKEITENLLSGDSLENNASKNIELTKIEEQGTIFKKLNDYFVGNREKTEINLNYPIYINGNSSLYNLSEGSTLISKDFEEIASYPNLSISEGKIYDGNNLERADAKEYIFVKTTDNIYINLYEIKVKTTANEYTIPVNSIIAFAENSIRYYSINNNVLVFNQINDIDNNSNVEMVENIYTYEELLTKLGILQDESNNTQNVENTQTDIIQENTANENNTNNDEKQNEETDEYTSADQNGYIKPEVTAENFTAEVYTAKSILHIKDPSGRIIEAPTFEIYKDGKIYLRRTFSNSGEIQITGLIPDTEYEVIGKYIYLNENNQKVENTFYEGTFTTKGYDQLGSIEIQKENGEIFSNKIQLVKVKITSDLNAEVLKGINQVEIETGEIRTVLKNNQVNELLQGKEITIESSEGLKSDSKINYTIKFYDKNGIELKVNNGEGETRTSKEAPTVRINIKEQDIVSVTLGLKLTNRNNVELENYKYVVTRPNGEIVQEKKLSENETELLLEDLDQNQYYKISIYADYDLNDNRGKQEQIEIGNLVFATQPISTLGSLELTVENKELTSTTSMISYKINEDRTDKRLIQILNELTINIKDGENIVKTDTLTEEEITNLQQAGTKEIKYENLKSNTTYTIEITGNVQLGNTQEEIPITYNYKEFTTLKIPAKVEIRNQFVTGNLIDFDVRIEDINNSVLNNTVRMELRNSSNDLIDLQELTTNEDYMRKTYEKLEENQTYRLSFYADQYNEGNTDETYKVNYLIKEIEIVTEPGISGSIGLTELSRKATGKNLVDMSSETKWYVYPNFNTNDYYGKEYNSETKTLTLGGNSNGRRAVYDLREYTGQEVKISFKAKTLGGTNAYIQNSKTDANRTPIQGLTTEWQEFQYTLTVDSTGYLGFYIQGGNGIEIQELQVELGNKKTSYEEFKYILQSSYSINLEDRRDEITTNDYYIKIYEDNNLVKEDRYEEISEENAITNAIKTYETLTGKNYKAELVIKLRDREYVLSELEYSTQDTEEIKGIYNKDDFLEIQPRGHYIVLGDIDLRGEINSQYRFGSTNLPFEGTIDFNGYKLIRDTESSNATIFYRIEESGIIKNLVLDIYMNNIYEITYFYGLFHDNYGEINNINVTLKECNNLPNKHCYLIGTSNYGTINKFIVSLESEFYGIDCFSSISENNYGTIKNGYIYGEKINGIYNTVGTKPIGGIVRNNIHSGIINNVFSLVNIEINEQIGTTKQIGNIAVNSIDTARVENVYSVISSDESDKYTGNGPNVYNTNANIKNSYYFSNETYNSTTDRKSTFLALYDKDFQNNVLNNENAFDIENTVLKGYYPQLQMSDCMPSQEYINLPEVQDSDLVDIISLEKIEENIEDDIVKIKINVNNPSAETITDIKIENIECEIESQEYTDGKSTVIAILKNPILYVSSYSVQSITSVGAYNLPYTRKFEENERIVYIDLYRKISTTDDWNNINNSPTENYMLVQDLDFKNNINGTITKNFKGKLNGNNFTIKNLKCRLMISIDNGSIENLNIQKVELTNISDRLAVFGNLTNGIINNVNIKDAKFNNSNSNVINFAGGLLGRMNGSIIRNCSVNNIEINLNCDNTLNVGGLIGQGDRSLIENSYVYNLRFNVNNYKDTRIGGIVGVDAYGLEINNTYAQGEINSNTSAIGGIVGTLYGTQLKNNLSNVKIVTTGENIGGISGDYKNSSKQSVLKNNLSIGDLYTNIKTENINYICGVTGSNILLENNYAYEKQKINGYYIEDNDLTLTIEELKNKETYLNKLKWTENFYLEDVTKGILPKLYNTDNEILLPNQEDMIIPTDNEVELRSVTATKDTINSAKIRIELINKNNIDINNLEIDGMNVIIDRISTSNGITYIDISATPNKYYDTYKITKAVANVNNNEVELPINARIELQFFKEIYTYEDWQNIKADSYENYRLMQDIDFNGRTNVNRNLCIARLETDGEKHALKNINLLFNSANEGFINDIKYSLKNISFQNITINKTSSGGNYSGIILNSSADISDIEVKDVTINGNNASYVSTISNMTNGSIDNCLLNNVKIYGMHYSAGLIGFSSSTENISNIKANNILIQSNGNQIGGIIGQADNVLVTEVEFTECNVIGNNAVGGIFGRIKGTMNVRGSNTEVSGNTYVGGVVGFNQDTASQNICVNEINVSGTGQYIGGIIGYGNATITKSSISNSNINGLSQNSKYLGGITGQASDCSVVSVDNCNVISNGTYVGGIWGYTANTAGNNNFFVTNTYVEGYSNVGGVGNMRNAFVNRGYVNADVVAVTNAGGLMGSYDNVGMTESQATSYIYSIIIADTNIQAESNAGGLIGYISTDLYYTGHTQFFYSNYVEADINCETESVSLGIGNRKMENDKIKDMYIYRYSTINGQNIENTNDNFTLEKMLTYNDLKEEATYTSKLKFIKSTWNFNVLADDKYPILNNENLPEQVGIDLPVDSEHIVDNVSTNSINKTSIEEKNKELEQTFTYDNKTIQTYNTYSLITSEDGTKATRNAKLYVKDNSLYVIPTLLGSTADENEIVPVANNLILDNYNGKEYETVLGSDGKIYDLKEPIAYPENFVNSDIESIGNNLSSSEKEVEVTYKNGDKIKFNYQTGEVISSSEANTEELGLFDYLVEKISEIGNSNSDVSQEITIKYEESKELQTKLEETSVEEAIEKQNNPNYIENGVTALENNETNNSLKENKYISMYNEETGQYEIYNEEELLDTSKEEVVSENEKIEANNLSEYYASEGESRNTKMGIVWIAISIIGVGIILFVLGIRGRSSKSL